MSSFVQPWNAILDAQYFTLLMKLFEFDQLYDRFSLSGNFFDSKDGVEEVDVLSRYRCGFRSCKLLLGVLLTFLGQLTRLHLSCKANDIGDTTY